MLWKQTQNWMSGLCCLIIILMEWLWIIDHDHSDREVKEIRIEIRHIWWYAAIRFGKVKSLTFENICCIQPRDRHVVITPNRLASQIIKSSLEYLPIWNNRCHYSASYVIEGLIRTSGLLNGNRIGTRHSRRSSGVQQSQVKAIIFTSKLRMPWWYPIAVSTMNRRSALVRYTKFPN